jgi:hypothetical protein
LQLQGSRESVCDKGDRTSSGRLRRRHLKTRIDHLTALRCKPLSSAEGNTRRQVLIDQLIASHSQSQSHGEDPIASSE